MIVRCTDSFVYESARLFVYKVLFIFTERKDYIYIRVHAFFSFRRYKGLMLNVKHELKECRSIKG